MSEQVSARQWTRIERWMNSREWGRGDGWRRRAWVLASDRRPWWDWGHRVMTLIGRDRHGDFDVPHGRDMWYRMINGKFVTTYNYEDVRQDNEGEAWSAFHIQDDGFTLNMGHWPQGHGNIIFYGLDRPEQALFLRWYLLEHKVRGEWLGLRRWAYYKALHAAVECKIPFTCQSVPPRGSGGYDHWHCGLKRKHVGEHRVHNYTWGAGSVEYSPVSS